MNPDIFFGGYQAYIKLMEGTVNAGYPIIIYLTDDNTDVFRYYQYHNPDTNIKPFAIYRKGETPIVGKNDIFIAYSCRDAYMANKLAQGSKFIFFIQEHETIFHRNDAIRFICASAYDLPHVPIFNSLSLRDYFSSQRQGIFAKDTSQTHYVFEHVTADIQAKERQADRKRKLIFYCRPEGHAERNLFEIGILAIKMALKRGYYRDWIIEGFGSLSGPHQYPLGYGQSIYIRRKMPLSEYEEYLQSADVGLSLMMAPHPGLVHFEMAKAGIITVVNTYLGRDENFFKTYSDCFIPVGANLDSIIDGLVSAIDKCDSDFDKSYKIKGTSWNEKFSAENLHRIYNNVNNTNELGAIYL
jgi:hypothetical protein